MLSSSDYTIQITSNRPKLAQEGIEHLKPAEANHFDGSGFESCAKMWNHAIADAKTEIVIISSDKSRATHKQVNQMVKLITEERFGFVTFCRFGFFGFHKDVIRKMGFFDERLVGGGFEDCDFARRLKLADIGIYESLSVPRVTGEHGWSPGDLLGAANFYFQKWNEVSRKLNKKILPEEDYNYDIGESKNIPFKKWSESESQWVSQHTSQSEQVTLDVEHSLINGWFSECEIREDYED